MKPTTGNEANANKYRYTQSIFLVKSSKECQSKLYRLAKSEKNLDIIKVPYFGKLENNLDAITPILVRQNVTFLSKLECIFLNSSISISFFLPPTILSKLSAPRISVDSFLDSLDFLNFILLSIAIFSFVEIFLKVISTILEKNFEKSFKSTTILSRLSFIYFLFLGSFIFSDIFFSKNS